MPFLCYRPPPDAPDVAPAAFEKNGHITFGSFSSLHKVTPKTIELWSRILLRLPSARLMLKNKSPADEAAANPLREEFATFRAVGGAVCADRRRIGLRRPAAAPLSARAAGSHGSFAAVRRGGICRAAGADVPACKRRYNRAAAFLPGQHFGA
jgi:hypothetical protein